MGETEVLLIGIGVALILIALMIEIEHKYIWNNYLNHYHKHKNSLIDKLMRPNRVVYLINIYLLWPAVIALGVWIILQNA
ncbi:MAG: hypothetical protein R3313_05325 [Candidatus Saccharimonadales bacterium]|nr:hypothetical protein [Candidatus Saccharimonadales bacterium]